MEIITPTLPDLLSVDTDLLSTTPDYYDGIVAITSPSPPADMVLLISPCRTHAAVRRDAENIWMNRTTV